MLASMRDSVYRLYLDFLETAEKKRCWSIVDDIPWIELDVSKATETHAQRVEIFCSEELYVPDYSAKGLELVRSMFSMGRGSRPVGHLKNPSMAWCFANT